MPAARRWAPESAAQRGGSGGPRGVANHELMTAHGSARAPSVGALVATAWLALVLAVTFPLGYALGVLLLAVTAPFDRERRWVQRFLSAWCHGWLRAWPGWRVTVTGRERIPAGACVLIANHQSMADILALMGLGVSFKFVSKASLFAVPFLGWIMRQMRYVPLRRGSHTSAEAMMRACDRLLEAGERVLLFPEGTYAPVPRRLPFRRGAFLLAQARGVPLVPVVLHGTSDLVFEDGPWFSPRSDVRVDVLEALTPPPRGVPVEGWMAEVEALYASPSPPPRQSR